MKPICTKANNPRVIIHSYIIGLDAPAEIKGYQRSVALPSSSCRLRGANSFDPEQTYERETPGLCCRSCVGWLTLPLLLQIAFSKHEAWALCSTIIGVFGKALISCARFIRLRRRPINLVSTSQQGRWICAVRVSGETANLDVDDRCLQGRCLHARAAAATA